jgi:RNase H-like domain found in reverse transcriptase
LFEEILDKAREKIHLHLPDPSKLFYARTDASQYGVGGYLFQKDEDGVELIIGFESKAFSSTSQNYSTIEKETLALINILDSFDNIIRGRKIIAEVDQRSLIWLARMVASGKCSKRLFSWFLVILLYDITIYHIPGSKNIIADTLSRFFSQNSFKDLEEHKVMCI